MKRYLIAIPVVSLLLLTSCYATRADVQKEADSLTNQVNQLREEVKGLQQQLAELRTAVGPAGPRELAGPRGSAQPAEPVSLQQDVSQLNQEVYGIVGPSSSTTSRIDNLRVDISQLNSEVYGSLGSASSSRIDKLEKEDISGLKTDVSSLYREVYGDVGFALFPSSRIDKLESRISSLERR